MVQKADIITIDGPSGSGKSTVASALALRLGYRYLDTGAMYRAVTLAALEAGLEMNPPNEDEIVALLDRLDLSIDEQGHLVLNGKRPEKLLRSDRVTEAVSMVSALKPVRSYLVKLQREVADIDIRKAVLGKLVDDESFDFFKQNGSSAWRDRAENLVKKATASVQET